MNVFSDIYRRLSATSAALWIASGVMLIIAASTFFPILFTLNTSLKASKDYMRDGIGGH